VLANEPKIIIVRYS